MLLKLKKIISISLILILLMAGMYMEPQQANAATTNPTLPTAAFTFSAPVTYVIHQHYLYGEDKGNGKMHTGSDFVCSYVSVIPSLPVGQTAKVIVASYDSSYGNYIVLEHTNGTNSNKIYTLYAHLNSINVSVNSTVTSSTILGVSGATGNVTGPHLHLEVRYASNAYGNTLNPEMMLSRSIASGVGALYGYVYGTDTYSIAGVRITGLTKPSSANGNYTFGSAYTYLPVDSTTITRCRDITDFDINYLVGQANTGTFSVVYSKSGYTSQTQSITISSGAATRKPILLY